MKQKPRIAILGAGPIGLEAALYARLKGYEVTVYEEGKVAKGVQGWGHVRMFSPFGMNSSEWGRRAMESAGCKLPSAEALLTGDEFAQKYLIPLSQLPEIRGYLNENARVNGVTRAHLLKTDLVGNQHRANDPFRILYSNGQPNSREQIGTTDVVLDCSGNYPGVPVCAGGLERDDEYLMWHYTLVYHSPDILGVYRPKYFGRRVLVVGAGHSAATSILQLQQLACEAPETSVIWVTRKSAELPIARIADDSLPERDRLAEQANAIALDPSSAVAWFPETVVCDTLGGRRPKRGDIVKALTERSSPVTVTLESLRDGQRRDVVVDQIIANTGSRPNRSLYEELQVHECYATQGPMKLAAKLLGETSADCLDQTSHGAEVLRNPEPNFYILGMKSYGRNSNFLIQIGLQQIVDVFTLIEQDWGS